MLLHQEEMEGTAAINDTTQLYAKPMEKCR